MHLGSKINWIELKLNFNMKDPEIMVAIYHVPGRIIIEENTIKVSLGLTLRSRYLRSDLTLTVVLLNCFCLNISSKINWRNHEFLNDISCLFIFLSIYLGLKSNIRHLWSISYLKIRYLWIILHEKTLVNTSIISTPRLPLRVFVE